MGVVYKARDTLLGRFVALKALPPESVADPERRQRFLDEAKAASALQHPGIVAIHDVVSADGRDFIVMELRDRGDPRAAHGPAGPSTQPRPALRRAGRRRPRPRPRRRHRPPRPQALERHGHRGRRGEDPRLRPRQAGRDAVPRRRHADAQRRPPRPAPQPRGRDRRHARLHVAGAGGREAGGRPDGHLLVRGAALPDADRPPPLPAWLSARDALGHPRGRPGGSDKGGSRPASRGRAGDPPLPAQGALAPLAEHGRPLGRPPRPARGLRIRAREGRHRGGDAKVPGRGGGRRPPRRSSSRRRRGSGSTDALPGTRRRVPSS